ncbi:hypothetical protein [Pseudomonas kitaguniensis]|uniref:hypothetical protein n=1 Tax=Pseudomonas kitaguniensis TaxID=2607908 RepID=UPI003D0372A5
MELLLPIWKCINFHIGIVKIISIGDVPTFVAAVKMGTFLAAGGQLGLTLCAIGKSVGLLQAATRYRRLHRTAYSRSLTD